MTYEGTSTSISLPAQYTSENLGLRGTGTLVGVLFVKFHLGHILHTTRRSSAVVHTKSMYVGVAGRGDTEAVRKTRSKGEREDERLRVREESEVETRKRRVSPSMKANKQMERQSTGFWTVKCEDG